MRYFILESSQNEHVIKKRSPRRTVIVVHKPKRKAIIKCCGKRRCSVAFNKPNSSRAGNPRRPQNPKKGTTVRGKKGGPKNPAKPGGSGKEPADQPDSTGENPSAPGSPGKHPTGPGSAGGENPAAPGGANSNTAAPDPDSPEEGNPGTVIF